MRRMQDVRVIPAILAGGRCAPPCTPKPWRNPASSLRAPTERSPFHRDQDGRSCPSQIPTQSNAPPLHHGSGAFLLPIPLTKGDCRSPLEPNGQGAFCAPWNPDDGLSCPSTHDRHSDCGIRLLLSRAFQSARQRPASDLVFLGKAHDRALFRLQSCPRVGNLTIRELAGAA